MCFNRFPKENIFFEPRFFAYKETRAPEENQRETENSRASAETGPRRTEGDMKTELAKRVKSCNATMCRIERAPEPDWRKQTDKVLEDLASDPTACAAFKRFMRAHIQECKKLDMPGSKDLRLSDLTGNPIDDFYQTMGTLGIPNRAQGYATFWRDIFGSSERRGEAAHHAAEFAKLKASVDAIQWL